LVDILDSKAPIYPVRKGKAGPAERFWAWRAVAMSV
jgi:hypothetical protein